MTEIKTHKAIDKNLSGELIEFTEKGCKVALQMTDQMKVDEHALIHGGFIFSLADYAAMLAVNDPNVVLSAADVRFLRPIFVGDKMIANAKVHKKDGRLVEVIVNMYKEENKRKVMFTGKFECYIPDQHVAMRKKH